MKYIIIILLLGAVISSAFAQKKYVDPNERLKRGLLEESDRPALPAPAVEAKVEGATSEGKEQTPQQSLCECGKLKSMNEQLDRLYWASNETVRAMVKASEIDARQTNVQATMVYIVSSHKNDPTPVDPDECPDTKIGENNMKQLKQIIAAQEKKCDVYKLRGI